MGNIWMFSNLIDEDDLEFAKHEYITYKMAVEYYNLGIRAVTRIAKQSESIYKVGKKVLIKRSLFEEQLRQERKIV